MANSTKSKEIEGNLSKAFATIDLDSKDLLFERVRAINEERDDYVNKRAIELASDEYLQRHFRDFVPGTPDEKATFIRSLSLERKIDIIADYTIERRIFEGNEQDRVKLSDIYKHKKENKLRYKEQALELINMYERILKENQTKIDTLKADIETTKSNIASSEAKLQEIIGKDDEALAYAGHQSTKFNKDKAIQEMQKNIASLKAKLSKQEKLLTELQEIQSKFEVEFANRKAEIEIELQKEEIYLYDRVANKEKSTDGSQENTKSDETKENEDTQTILQPAKQVGDRNIAKAMMDDFFNLSPEDQRKLLDRMDNQGILDMARKLGQVNRARFNVILNARLDELKQDSIDFNGISITKQELKDMKHISPDKLKAIREELDTFNSEFENKSIDEIETFESKLQYVRIGALLSETGSLRGITRFLDGISSKGNGNAIFELSKSFARYAEIKRQRTCEKDNWVDLLRAEIGRKPKHKLAKDGTIQLNRDPNKKSRFEGRSEDR